MIFGAHGENWPPLLLLQLLQTMRTIIDTIHIGPSVLAHCKEIATKAHYTIIPLSSSMQQVPP